MKRLRVFFVLLMVALLSMSLLFGGCGPDEEVVDEPEENGEEAQDEDAELDYPTGPISLIIPWPTGGAYDLGSRALEPVLEEALGVPVTIVTREGAGTVTGVHEAAQSTPDGHTLLASGEHAMVLGSFEDIPVNFTEELEPVTGLMSWQYIFAVPGDESPNPSPFYSLEEFLDHAEENPQDLIVGNIAAYTLAHLPVFQLEGEAGVEFTHISYGGGAPTLMAIQSGEADAAFAVAGVSIEAANDGYIRPFAVSGSQRHPELPDVPTFEELGYDIPFEFTYGIFVPKDTPEEIISYLEEVFAEIAQNETYIETLETMGEEVNYRTREELRDHFIRIHEIAEYYAQ